MPAIARHLLGEPPAIEAGGDTWRYGKRGSLAVHVDGPRRGTFRDFEAGKSGGVLDLVLHLVEHVNDRTAAAAWLQAEGLAPHDPQTPVKRRTPVHPSGPGPDRERQRDDADARALAYARSIWSATAPSGEVDAVRRYLARRWCWPPEIALPDCVRWLSVPAARIASRRLPDGAAGALVFGFDVDAQADAGRGAAGGPGRGRTTADGLAFELEYPGSETADTRPLARRLSAAAGPGGYGPGVGRGTRRRPRGPLAAPRRRGLVLRRRLAPGPRRAARRRRTRC